MKARTSLMLALLLVLSVGMAQAVPFFGNWEGQITGGEWSGKKLTAQIVGTSGNTYKCILSVEERTLGEIEGISTSFRENNRDFKMASYAGVIDLGRNQGGKYIATAQAFQSGVMEGAVQKQGISIPFRLERVEKKSPTLGMAPPAGAKVILSKKPTQDEFEANWKVPPHWIVHRDGSISKQGGGIVMKEALGSGTYHLEFYTPYMPDARGQARGNAGFYLLGCYEVQVLDNFTDDLANNHCGGIYQQATPQVKACLPPTEWQTYDIDFSAPEFDSDGKKIKNARITARHNGLLIHDDVELKKATPGGVSSKEASEGTLYIQDHGDVPHMRNMWFVPAK